MDTEMKDDWLDALRSGDYKKGVGYLAKNNKFCCLGILAEINGGLSKRSNKIKERYLLGSGKNVRNLSCKVSGFHARREHYGLSPYEQKRLIDINDSTISFEQVIKYIEENL